MKIIVAKSFERDYKKASEDIKKQVIKIRSLFLSANSLHDVPHIKKMEGSNDYYRCRIGNYRIGLKLKEGVVYFLRVINRRDIYKQFP